MTTTASVSTGARGTLSLNYMATDGSVLAAVGEGVIGGIETLQARRLQIKMTAATATCNAGEGHAASYTTVRQCCRALCGCWRV